MSSDKVLLIFAVILFVVSGAWLLVSYSQTTGFATSTGTANLSVESSASVNFTTNNINWASGKVNIGSTNATLDTSAGTVSGGNWTVVSQGLVLENIGNTNATLDIKTGKTAATFLGGTSPSYKYNVSNVEANSCVNASAFDIGAWYVVNTSGDGTRVCDVFGFANGADTIRIDLQLVVPSDSKTGALGDIITATAT